MSSVIITVVVVLGIIVAGGFLLYFMGDLFMSLAHKKKDDEAISNKQAKETEELKQRIEALENKDELKKDPEVATILYNGAVVEAYNPDEEAQEENNEETEENEVEETTEEQETEEPVEETEEEAEEEEETEEDDTDDTSDFIKQRRAELMERLARMQNEQEEAEEEEETEEDVVDLSSEEEAEEPAEETTEEQTEESEEQTEEQAEEKTAEEESEEVEEDIVREDDSAVTTYEEAKDSTEGLASTMSLEELESKLAEEQEKLKANEKELRQVKKEFIPLRRVKKTLESDEKKLRRKEALVAKQKVVLYGVNNYADIDEEKAKKLAEDLDLLDGLKLSVQHCEEVMEKNQERYPLLEKIFNLLSSQNTEIKEDIKKLQDAIAQLKDSDDNADAE